VKKWLSVLLVLVLAVGIGSVPSAAARTYRLTVVFKSATLPADAERSITEAGGTVNALLPEVGTIVATGPASLIKALNARDDIAAASPTFRMTIDAPQRSDLVEATTGKRAKGQAVNQAAADLYQKYQWDIKQVTNDGGSWAINPGSHQTVVAVVDTGINYTHPALSANFLGGRNFVDDDGDGAVDPNAYMDLNGHGSHCAGAIAGNGRILGVGPELGIRAYRVLDANGSGYGSDILQGMLAAVLDDVDVISMSLGGYYNITPYYWTDPDTGVQYKFQDVADYLLYQRVVDFAMKNDVVVVASAGNDAIDITNPTVATAILNEEYGPDGWFFRGATQKAPAELTGVVCVSATGPDYSPASYTNYGPGAIDVSGPGGDFPNYPNPGWWLDMCLSANEIGSYTWMAGTSMSTPKVAAVAALVIDQARQSGAELTPSQVIAILQQSAIDMGKTGCDAWYGSGFVNAANALNAVK
jgi:subtilisin family serine protease